MTFRATFEHRDALLDAALHEFCDRGYDGASLNRILSAAGMSKGQLYHHFAGKEGLYLGLVGWMIDEKAAWFANHPLPGGDGLFATLAHHMRASIEFAAANPDIDRFSRSLLSERGRPVFDAAVKRFGFDAGRHLAALIAQARRHGELRSDLPADLIERAVLLVVNHIPELLDLHRPAELGPRIDDVLDVLRNGVADGRKA